MKRAESNTWSPQVRYRFRTVEAKRYRTQRPAFMVQSLTDLDQSQHPTYDGGIRQIDLEQTVYRALETITPREERAVRHVLGIGMDAATLDEVGQSMGCSPSRAAAIYQKALRKLRHHGRAKYLREFLVNT